MFFWDYKQQLVVDFRRTYGLSLYKVGEDYSYTEALELINGLLQTTDSYLNAKLNSWKRPFTDTEYTLWNYIDYFLSANGGKKEYQGRAYDNPNNKLSLGSKISIEQAKEIYKVVRKDYTKEEIKAINAKWLKDNALQQVEGTKK